MVADDTSESCEESQDLEDSSSGKRSAVKRPSLLAQENMIVVCQTNSDQVIMPDRPVSFPDLDYRLDIKEDLFSEREIQIISNAVEMEAHIICLSCVEKSQDVQEARRVLKKARGHHIHIYSKI